MTELQSYATVIVTVAHSVDVSDFEEGEVRPIPNHNCLADDLRVPKEIPTFGTYGMDRNRDIYVFYHKWNKL